MSNVLEIRLFGHPELRLHGQLLAHHLPHKALALLYYLALAEQPIGRETVALLLWPDAAAATAKHSLRNLLSLLRKALGDALVITHRTIAFSPAQRKQIDVVAFQQGLAALQQSQLRAEAPDFTLWQATIDLYRGDFLEGFYINQSAPFEEWTMLRRESLRQQLITSLFALSEAHAAAGATEAALACLARLLTFDPQSEAVYSRQIQLLLGLGRRAEAWQQYERYRVMLDVEFNIAPPSALTALVAGLQLPPANQEHPPQWSRTLPTAEVNPVAMPLPLLNWPPPPSPATAPLIPHNLTKPLSVFVGRERELAYITQRIAGADCRLLTIVGLGGMGKTSLAQEAAQRILHTNPAAFPDGIYFVALAGLTTTPSTTQESGIAEALLIAAIAEQIGCELQGGLSAQAQLQNYLQHCRLLLVLDNFEQLLEATDLLIALLTHAPAVTMLVTSRARLKVRGESVLPLSKLSLPSAAYVTGTAAVQASIIPAVGDDMWQESEAIAMFVQRAQCFDPHFAITPANLSSVMQICYLVDGLPLGIELATSMLPLLSCADLAKELAQSLAFLAVETRDLPHDQRTLGAVFARSWQLLPPDGQQLLAKLALFPHTFSYAAAVQIAGASNALLQRLIDHSLLCKVGDERYAMHHTVRTFAEEKLQQWPTQLAMLQVQFAHFYLDFLAQRERGLTGAAHALVTEQILTDWDNIRMAWRWAVAHELAAALRTCVNTLFLFYDQQGFYLEALDLYEYALHAFFPIYEAQPCKAGTDVTWLIGRLQTCCAVCHSRLGHVQAALRAFESSWAILQEADSPVASAFCLTHWGVWLTGRDPQRSTEFLTQALGLIQASGVAWLQALIGQSLGEIILLLGDYVAAEANVTQGLRLAQQLNWPRALISGHKALGRIHLARGHYDQAEKALHTAIGLAEHYHFKLLGLESMVALGEALRLQGQLAAAKACFSEVRQLIEPLGLVIPTAFILWEEGCLAEQCGDYRAAKALFSESLTAGLPPWWSHVLPTLGWALIGLGELVEAQRYFQKVLADAEAQARLPIVLDAQVGVAYIAMLQANTGQARAGELNPAERVNTVLQRVYQHGAATQETRTRVAKIAARLDFPRLKVTLPPPTPVAWTIVY